MVTDPAIDVRLASFATVVDAVQSQRDAWLSALVTETRNRTAGPFKRHVRSPGDAVALDSHPFVIVACQGGQPLWSYQVSDRHGAIRFHTNASPVVHLTAEHVADRRAWMLNAGLSIARELTSGGPVSVDVWARDTLKEYDRLCAEWTARLRAAMEAAKL